MNAQKAHVDEKALDNLIDDQKYSFHIYGKKRVKSGRKMGHFTKRS